MNDLNVNAIEKLTCESTNVDKVIQNNEFEPTSNALDGDTDLILFSSELETKVDSIEDNDKILENNTDLSVKEKTNLTLNSFNSDQESKESVESSSEASIQVNFEVQKKRRYRIDSESENEDVSEETVVESSKEATIESNVKMRKKRIYRIGSESEDEQDFPEESPINSLSESDKAQKSRLVQLCDSESEDEKRDEDGNVESEKENLCDNNQHRRLAMLCDSESSGDEKNHVDDFPDDGVVFKTKKNKNNVKVSTKEKKMTGREAAVQMREIKSESQRMVRESRFSLPYHRPKSYTLQDFLKRKSQIKDVIRAPPNMCATHAIKMTATQLVREAKRLKEREEELKLLYKSESESETEEEMNIDDQILKDKEEPETSEETVLEISKQNEDVFNARDEQSVDGDVLNLINDLLTSLEETSLVHKELEQEKVNVNQDVIDEELNTENEVISDLPYEEDVSNEELNNEKENSDDLINEVDLNEKEITEEVTPDCEQKEEETHNVDESTKINLPNFAETKFKKLKIDLNFKPSLNRSSNDIIVFDEGLDQSKGVNNLIERFCLHIKMSEKKKKENRNSDYNESHYVSDDDEDNEWIQTNPTPGAKLKKLKEELEKQMAKNRLEELAKRNEEKAADNELENIYEGEKNDCGNEAMLDDEAEEDFTDTESSSESEEDEEEEEVLYEERRVTSAFVDDEAEDSDADDEEDDDDDEEMEIQQKDESKPLKRIITAFEDDSDDDANERDEHVQEINGEDDEDIPLHQPLRDGLEKTPCKSRTESKSDLAFLTPTINLTALQGMALAPIITEQSPALTSLLPPEPSPLKVPFSLKTRLFAEPEDEGLDELEGLCSGKFTRTNSEKEINLTQEEQLLDIFPEIEGKSQIENESNGKDGFECKSQETEINQITQNVPDVELVSANSVISDNLDNNSKTEADKEHPPINSKYVLASSDEDEPEPQLTAKSNKKRRNYIEDDDVSETNEQPYDELDDIDSPESESEESGSEEEKVRVVDYDSEENEIERNDDERDEDLIKEARDFFEAEAELSESDWGSADEDEKGLDDFEMEEGDKEKYNEKKIQRELERIHVRQVIDDDKREVKLLQELLLEDGEMHGVGRERKFRWKNADTFTWNDSDAPKEEDEDAEEMETEFKLRVNRHEREVFLRQHQAQMSKEMLADSVALSSNNAIIKLGQAALRKSFIESPKYVKPVPDSDIKMPFTLPSKRGSFLARGEIVLSKLAELTQFTDNPLAGPKNSKNFVFTSVSETETIIQQNEKKRKMEIETEKVLKKMRIVDMSPATQKCKKGP